MPVKLLLVGRSGHAQGRLWNFSIFVICFWIVDVKSVKWIGIGSDSIFLLTSIRMVQNNETGPYCY